MTAAVPVLHHPLVRLEPASDQNVDLLVQWTLDPVAQGPYKRVPAMTVAERRALTKAGFVELGPLPHPHYRVEPPPEPCVIYVRIKGAEIPASHPGSDGAEHPPVAGGACMTATTKRFGK